MICVRGNGLSSEDSDSIKYDSSNTDATCAGTDTGCYVLNKNHLLVFVCEKFELTWSIIESHLYIVGKKPLSWFGMLSKWFKCSYRSCSR